MMTERIGRGDDVKHVVMFSAGAGSWAAAKRVVAKHGVDNVVLLFTDTLSEDEDTYRFLIEGAANVFGIILPTQAIPRIENFPPFEDRLAYKLFVNGLRLEMADLIPGLVWIAEGRDVWDVFFSERFLGNSSFDPCSRALKRKVADRWLRDNRDKTETVCHVGIDFTESHRYDDGQGGGIRPRRAKEGWTYEAPMMSAPWLMKPDVLRMMKAEGLKPPRLYEDGFPHGNCRGFCIKAGQGQFKLLLDTNPTFYAYNENKEIEIQEMLGTENTILTDRSGDGKKKPLSLKDFRERIQGNNQSGFDFDEWGGCGCFLDAAE